MQKSLIWLHLLFPSAVLISFSLTSLGSLNQAYLEQQSVGLLVAGFVFWLFYAIDYRFFTSLAWVWYLLANLSLVITYLAGTLVRGSTSWLELGLFRFQPSEFAKPMLAIFFAAWLTKAGTLKHYIWTVILAAVPFLLVFAQPDLGSALMIGFAIACQILLSQVPKKYLGTTALLVLLAAPTLFSLLRPYQQARIRSYFEPSDPLGSGYNAIQAVISVGSGRLTGRGLGQGTQSQLMFLPERQTDFIFSAISEEFGFIGSVSVVAAFIWLLWTITSIISSTPDPSGKLIGVSAFSIIAFQTFINIGMNIGLVPITGITLPLVSLGGSSLIATGALLGLVANISRQRLPSQPLFQLK